MHKLNVSHGDGVVRRVGVRDDEVVLGHEPVHDEWIPTEVVDRRVGGLDGHDEGELLALGFMLEGVRECRGFVESVGHIDGSGNRGTVARGVGEDDELRVRLFGNDDELLEESREVDGAGLVLVHEKLELELAENR